jgi:formylglycine-generating enzyme required for sulfatase activity
MSDVGTFKGASPFGAYDMVGNAWEWTASDFKADQGEKLPAESTGDLKVIRGGSWASWSEQATATFRRSYGASGEKRGYSYTGIRLVKDIN